MRITIFAIGTQGDIRPFSALGRGLKRAGHEVRLATSANFQGLVTRAGLEFAPLTADYEKLMLSDPEMINNGMNVVKVARIMRGHLSEMASHWAEEGRAAAAGAELLIGAGPATILVASLSDALGIPCVQAQLQPMTPCSDIPPMMLPPPKFKIPGIVNLGLYHALRMFTWKVLSPAINGILRKDLGLAPYSWRGPYYCGPETRRRVLYGYSSVILPHSRDWTDNQRVTGYWFLDEADEWQPPEDLVRFLDAGPKPVYIGFGSMLSNDAERITRIVLAAVKQVGCRAILATGWGGMKTDEAAKDENIFVLQQAPHDWLFPRCEVAVHHGGAGTTTAAARAGIPSVIMPFITEQAFWSDRLQRLGTAPPYLDRKTVTASQMAKAIAKAREPAMIRRAAEVGVQVAAERGIDNAIRQLADWGLLSPAREAPPAPAYPAFAAEAAGG